MRKTVLDAPAILAALFRKPGAGVVEAHDSAKPRTPYGPKISLIPGYGRESV